MDPVLHISFHGSGISHIKNNNIKSIRFERDHLVKDIENTIKLTNDKKKTYDSDSGYIIILKTIEWLKSKLKSSDQLKNSKKLHLQLHDSTNYMFIKYDSKDIRKDIERMKEKNIIESSDIIFTIKDNEFSIGDTSQALTITPDAKSMIELIPGTKTFGNPFRRIQQENNFQYSYNSQIHQ